MYSIYMNIYSISIVIHYVFVYVHHVVHYILFSTYTKLVIYFKNKYLFVAFNQVKVTSILMFAVKVIITVDFSKLARIDLTY